MKEKNYIYTHRFIIFILSFLFLFFDLSLTWGSSKPAKPAKNTSIKKEKTIRKTSAPKKANKTSIKTKSYRKGASAKLTPQSSANLSPQTYVVKRGDTPQKISQKFNIPWEEIKRANQLKTSKLISGQKLLIPQENNLKALQSEGAPAELVSGEKFTRLHRVAKGETLYRIAKRYQVSVEEIKEWSKISEKDLKPGMELKIPIGKASVKKDNPKEEHHIKLQDVAHQVGPSDSKILTSRAEESPQEEAQGEHYRYHVVQKGETLYRISLLYNVPVEKIKKLNNLEGNLISVGQRLKIPHLEESSPQPFVFESPAKELKAKEESLPSKFEKNIMAKNKILTPSMLSKDDELTLKRKFIEISTAYADSRYKLGGEGGGYLDCSSFVKYVFQEIGIKLPRSSAQQFQVGIAVNENELIPGDLVFFRTRGKNISHVGIYIGDNRFIHISSSKKRVAIDSLEDPYFKKRYAGAKRVLNGEVLEYFQDYLQKRELSPGSKLEKDKLSKAQPSQDLNPQEVIF